MPVVTFSFDRIDKMLPGIKLETSAEGIALHRT